VPSQAHKSAGRLLVGLNPTTQRNATQRTSARLPYLSIVCIDRLITVCVVYLVLLDWVLEEDVLPSEGLVDGAEGLELALGGVLLLGVQEGLEDLGAVGANLVLLPTISVG